MIEDSVIIIDVETTGFSYSKDHIIEIGMVELNIVTGKKILLYSEFVAPELDLDELQTTWILSQGHINILDIVFAKSLEDQRQQIQGLLNLYPIGCTAYNNTFDFGFMEAKGFELPKKLGCPMRLSVDICKKQAVRKDAGKYKYPSAEEAYNHFFPGSNHKTAHRGGDDAWHEADIVYELYKLGIFKID